MGAQTVQDHADFRLMSNVVLHELSKYNETNLFLRGVVMELGFSRSIVYFERKERLAGETKYPLSKMINLAVDGITSFSIKPIKQVTEPHNNNAIYNSTVGKLFNAGNKLNTNALPINIDTIYKIMNQSVSKYFRSLLIIYLYQKCNIIS